MRQAKWIAGMIAAGVTLGYGTYQQVAAAEKAVIPAPLSFVALAPGNTMVLDVSSRGCFGGSRYRLEYTPVPSPRVLVTAYETKWRKKPGTKEETPYIVERHVGVVTLAPAQLERLDNRLRYYREKHNSGCTTEDIINVATFHDGVKTASESYRDASCTIDELDDADPRDIAAYPNFLRRLPDGSCPVLSVYHLTKIAEEAGKQNAPLPYRDLPRTQTPAYKAIQEYKANVTRKALSDIVLKRLPGFDAVNKSFILSSADHAHYYPQGDAFSADLEARDNRLVGDIGVYIRVKDDRPAQNWEAILPIINRAEQRTQKIAWITSWKKTSPDHRVTLTFDGTNAIEEDEPESYVYPAWRHAGLRGLPNTELKLRWGKFGRATLYIGDKDNRVLLISADGEEAEPGVWFSAEKMMYHPTQKVPEYYVVAPDGTGTRNTRPDPETRAWFIKTRKLNLPD